MSLNNDVILKGLYFIFLNRIKVKSQELIALKLHVEKLNVELKLLTIR